MACRNPIRTRYSSRRRPSTRSVVTTWYSFGRAVAHKVIQKYQNASCEQLWQQKGQPKSPEEQRAVQFLHNDPQARQAFFNRVSAPIVNKLFECGMIP